MTYFTIWGESNNVKKEQVESKKEEVKTETEVEIENKEEE